MVGETSEETRTPAADLRMTFRADGALLLELLADGRAVLGIAESKVDDAGGIATILNSWARGQGEEEGLRRLPEPGHPYADVVTRRRDYSRGVTAGLLRRAGPHRFAIVGSQSDERLFAEMFGSLRPTDQARLEAFIARVTRGMNDFFRRARAMAAQRLAGDAYLAVLSDYLEHLRGISSDQSAYRLVEHTLVPLIEDERYLRLAEDGRARELVAEIDDVISVLYGQCMDLERGGQIGLRRLPARPRR